MNNEMGTRIHPIVIAALIIAVSILASVILYRQLDPFHSCLRHLEKEAVTKVQLMRVCIRDP